MIEIGKNQKIIEIIRRYGKDIINSESYQVEREYCQHGVISTYEHSLAVTYTSVYLALKSKKPVNMRSIVRGALLHDFYMYDWHNPEVKGRKVHGYTHARRAMENAIREFGISALEQKIIYCHMFPLNLTRVPTKREALIVCMADKICATFETIKFIEYNRITNVLNREKAIKKLRTSFARDFGQLEDADED
jgi:Predicted HD superfamily hydrolase